MQQMTWRLECTIYRSSTNHILLGANRTTIINIIKRDPTIKQHFFKLTNRNVNVISNIQFIDLLTDPTM